MRLRHGRTELELHTLTERAGPRLLLLHELGGSSADWAEAPAAWPGGVFALDFSGHGHSQRVAGGGYWAESLAADADAALAYLGDAALAGAGIGAYVALLLAGARPARAPAALLLPGRGLAGGGPQPDFDRTPLALAAPGGRPPLPPHCDTQLSILEWDARPPEYATRLAAAARRLLLLDDGGVRPPWWEAVRRLPAATSISGDAGQALTRLAAAL
jgi:hypothetical protein